jgi:hypothetical protein
MTKRGVLAVALCAALVWGCAQNAPVKVPFPIGKMSDEEQVAFVLDDVWQGMQTGRVYKVLAHVSSSYLDQEGRDYEAMQEYLAQLFRSYSEIKITRTQPKILVIDNRARAVETFGTVAKPKDAKKDPPINLQGQVTVYLERAGDAWQIVEWGPLR